MGLNFFLWVCLKARYQLLSGWCEALSYTPRAPVSSCCVEGEVLLWSPVFDQACARALQKNFQDILHALWQLRIFVGRLRVSLQYLYPLTVGEKSDISIQLCSHLFIKSVGQDFLDIFCYIMIDFNLSHLEHTCQWS